MPALGVDFHSCNRLRNPVNMRFSGRRNGFPGRFPVAVIHTNGALPPGRVTGPLLGGSNQINYEPEEAIDDTLQDFFWDACNTYIQLHPISVRRFCLQTITGRM